MSKLYSLALVEQTFIDARNLHLWNVIKKNRSLSFEVTQDSVYSVMHDDTTAIFFIPDAPPSIESFSHELLHVYIEIKGFKLSSLVTMFMAKSLTLQPIVSPELLLHVGNCIDHKRMLPLYLECGFARELFIHDYQKERYQEFEILAAETLIHTSSWHAGANIFIATFFSIMANLNDVQDDAATLFRLQGADPQLYSILWDTWHRWESRKTFEVYHQFSYYLDDANFLIESLEQWVEAKSV
jgi:hypothetical protein